MRRLFLITSKLNDVIKRITQRKDFAVSRRIGAELHGLQQGAFNNVADRPNV